MQNEAKGIILELTRNFRESEVAGSTEIKVALQKVYDRLNAHQTTDVVLVDRLANYITYTVFTNKIRLTQTQNLLLSQLMSIGRTCGIDGGFHGHCGDASQFD
ncbi:bacteriocin immunity protein [Lactiplantibacillus sp. WILCCON 0030]|uniref:Bacteriocin immunity protein n=1 Tax=Lactiplantibacillus brownii TaxID=3069269 RepID=A0ABU1ABD7_9LACO|nr:bacteriocin immunity protein [Lactiplantibacillus brownii]MDQ7938282.1 bacteriocin immunity protein [Lactiplantibacillus brownii]